MKGVNVNEKVDKVEWVEKIERVEWQGLKGKWLSG